ncbi:MAG: GGDEF domain-containing protein, partial [Phycisphaerae bacterium]|nr:GGDEF domain-containing protein [Phycisphaerae bacterium]
MITRDFIINKIHRCSSLPSLPVVAMKVLGLAQSEDVDLREIAELISKDPALSTKVLKTVNSPFYGLTKSVSTISNALVILGTESVKTLVLGFSLVNSLYDTSLHSQTQLAYWQRSIYGAAGCRLLSQRMNVLEREELFLAALLEDIGVQVLKQVVPAQYDAMLADSPDWGRRLIRRELAELGVTHCEAGVMLAEQWNLPPIIREVIRCHHRPRLADPRLTWACNLVRLAGLCTEVFMGCDGPRQVGRVRRYAAAVFEMGPDACDTLLKEIGTTTHEMADLFDINIGQQRSYDDIMAEANDALQYLTLQSQMRVREMRAAAETDALTGAATRRKLDECLEAEFRQAVKANQPLSVIFIDADHFKNVNDTFGHAAGDQALAHLARLIISAVRPSDLVGRYGGEEFCVVLPQTKLPAAAVVAERIRALIDSRPVELPTGPLKLTVSTGVAGMDG